MLNNGITVYCDGQTRHLELDKQQAEKFLWYAGAASAEESVPDREYPIPEAEVSDRGRRSETIKEHAVTFKAYLGMLGNLNEYDLAHVLSFLDLLEYGDSWMREAICGLLMEVRFSGPAKANERSPRDVLADIAYDLFDWWDHIDTARSHAEQHPELFPRPATPEPPAAEETTQPATKQPAKAQRARKARKRSA